MYCQYPCLFDHHLIYVSAHSLWRVSWPEGGKPERLTETLQGITTPHFSPDGEKIAFAINTIVYLLPFEGGVPERIATFTDPAYVVGWTKEGSVLVASSQSFPFRSSYIYKVCPLSFTQERLPFGPCESISYGPHKGSVIQRHGYGYTRWHHYQGGQAGQLWIDTQGAGEFKPLLSSLNHNLLSPLWVGERIYFLSDDKGKGNLFSCTVEGEDRQQHTYHDDFYIRHLSHYQETFSYSCVGDLFVYHQGKSHKITIETLQKRLKNKRVSKDPEENLTHYHLSPEGKYLSLTTRGRIFSLTPYQGPVLQKGAMDSVRYHGSYWLKDGRLLTLRDKEGIKEEWEFYTVDSLEPVATSSLGLKEGRVIHLAPHPLHSRVAGMNHQHQLMDIDFEGNKSHLIDTSPSGPFQGYSWSPCGRWLAYSKMEGHKMGSSLWLYDSLSQEKHCLLPSSFSNSHPVFDPDGRYLYFLSSRHFSFQWDPLESDLICQPMTQPFVLVLKKDQEAPFILPLLGKKPSPDSSEKELKKESSDEKSSSSQETEAEKPSPEKQEKKVPETVIDLEGIADRLLCFPLPARQYRALFPLKGQVMYAVGKEKTELFLYDFSLLKEESLVSGIDSVVVSSDYQWMTYEMDHRLRTIRAGSKPDETPDLSYHQGGWLDWKRISLSVAPAQEWLQMFYEAWRLQKEMFWRPDMKGIDWDAVYQRYRPYVERVTSHSELLDIIGHMHGELGTSHAYVFFSQKKEESLGMLGAELSYDPEAKAYRVAHFFKGDLWNGHPLLRPGVNIQKGDFIWAIDGQRLSEDITPFDLLSHKKNQPVSLLVSHTKEETPRTVIVFPISRGKEKALIYRDWVNTNRDKVYDKTQGRGGYVHIPDMQKEGYAEFLRGYWQDFDQKGLIIDARYNGGGNISYLILDLLMRRRIGCDQTRHMGISPYPPESPRGPMVALINECTGSDGDIFAHAFRSFNLGPMIGKRTWGGVVGIWPRYNLLDGTMTSQPEFSIWLQGVGWKVENYGVDPTIEVEITPQDYAKGYDPQLEKGIETLTVLMEKDEERQKTLQPPSS